jgi:uncharacterized protein YlxW (UPF0749 family)
MSISIKKFNTYVQISDKKIDQMQQLLEFTSTLQGYKIFQRLSKDEVDVKNKYELMEKQQAHQKQLQNEIRSLSTRITSIRKIVVSRQKAKIQELDEIGAFLQHLHRQTRLRMIEAAVFI